MRIFCAATICLIFIAACATESGGTRSRASSTNGQVQASSTITEEPNTPADGGSTAMMAGSDGGVAPTMAGSQPLPQLTTPAPLPPTPQGLPSMEDSKDNPTTAEKAELGKMLFFDKRLSKDDSMACVDCHQPDKAWTDNKALSPKVGGALNKRNTPAVINMGYHSLFYWDGRKPTLEDVSHAAWTGQLGADAKAIDQKLGAIPMYRALFMRAFNKGPSGKGIKEALAAFLRVVRSGNSAWDKFEAGDKKAVSKEVQRGFEVFRKASCAQCHTPPLYTDLQFHNVGIGSDKAEAERDHGRMDATKDAADDGKFKTPTLRDIAKTAPYFHDGSVASLDEAIEYMAAGPKKGVAADEKWKAQKLTKKDKVALRAFLESLTSTASDGFTAPTLP